MGAGDLAELLRELKERSGLSYGALAKRLHMSTSTLHRYVNGTAVPTEFAPVERLARLCRATPEEMVEAHRRWILADAARGRKGEAASGGSASGGQASGGASASGAGAAAEAVREPVREPAAEPVRKSASEPVREPAAEPVRKSASEPVREPAADPDFGPAPEPAAAPEPSRRPARFAGRRRRLAVLAAVGVVLAVATTALAVQRASSGSADGGKSAADAQGPTAGGEADGDGGGKRTPDGPSARTSASGKGPDKEPGKGKDKGERHGGAHDEEGGKGGDGRKGGTGAPSSGGGGGGGGSAVRGTPLTVSTQPQFWAGPCGHPYLVDRSPDRLSPPPNEQDAAGWAAANGAVSAGRQTVKLTVQGTGKETVVLESLDVRVVGSDAPLAWNSYSMGYVGVGCGGNVPKHTFGLDLDASVPRLAAKSGESGFPYKVSENDPEAFYIEATAKSRHVRWYLELEWSSGARHGTVRIGDTGKKPFRTSGDRGRPTFGYSLDHKKWVKTRREANGAEYEIP